MKLGTAKTNSQKKILLLGSGELGKEFAISAQRLGLYVIAADRYENAPAMHVAHESYVLNMQDRLQLRSLIINTKPDYIVPEIEAIATDELVDLETKGFRIVPCAKAVKLTMDREGIRRLAAEELNLPTSKFMFAETKEEYEQAIEDVGLPYVIKPVMSSSGKGQSIVKKNEDIQKAWQYAQSGSRGSAKSVIVEQFIPFDYEITLLTVRHEKGTSFCEPIGHIQEKGDYQLSWQPQAMPDNTLKQAQHIAKKVTDALGGYGIFGVELFVKGEKVYFNEVSPRPHDTGLVTLISQRINEFDLHLRAILGLPVPDKIPTIAPSASAALLLEGDSDAPEFEGVENALSIHNVDVYLFGKPEIKGSRRMGVVLVKGDDVDHAKSKALQARELISIVK